MPSTPSMTVRLLTFFKSYRTEQGLRALRNLIGLVFWTGLSQLCAFGLLLLLTNLFDPVGFGAIVFGLSVQSYLLAFSCSGMHLPTVRDLTQKPALADQTVTAFLTIVLGMSLITGMVTILLAILIPISIDEKILLCLIALGNLFASLNLSPIYDAEHRQALVGMLAVPGDLLVFLSVLLLGLTGGLSVPVVGVLLASKWMITFLLQAIVLWRFLVPFRWRFDLQRIRELHRSGWPIMLASVCYLAPLHGSVVLVRMLHGERDAAVFGLAFQIAQAYLMVAWLVTRILQPHIAGRYGLHRSFILKLCVICSLIFGGTWIAALAGGWFLTHRILAEQYRASFTFLTWLLPATVAYAIAMVLNSYLARLKIERTIMLAYVMGLITYSLCTLLGWRLWQIDTFPLAILAGATTLVCVMAWQLRSRMSAHSWQDPLPVEPGT